MLLWPKQPNEQGSGYFVPHAAAARDGFMKWRFVMLPKPYGCFTKVKVKSKVFLGFTACL